MRSRHVDLDGPVHLADFGGDGRPILLIHGIGSSHANFAALGPMLTDHGHVLAVDLVGFGYTPPAGRASDLRTNRRMLVRLVDEVLDEPPLIVGTSMGGLLAMLVAAAVPASVSGLVLIGPGQPRPRGVPVDAGLALQFLALTLPVVGKAAAAALYRADPEVLVADLLERVCAHPDRVPDHAVGALTEVARRRRDMSWQGDSFRQAARSMVRELRRTSGFKDFVRALRPPTLVVQGCEDELVAPEATARLVALRDDWELVELPDVGHSPQLEAAPTTAELVRRR